VPRALREGSLALARANGHIVEFVFFRCYRRDNDRILWLGRVADSDQDPVTISKAVNRSAGLDLPRGPRPVECGHDPGRQRDYNSSDGGPFARAEAIEPSRRARAQRAETLQCCAR